MRTPEDIAAEKYFTPPWQETVKNEFETARRQAEITWQARQPEVDEAEQRGIRKANDHIDFLWVMIKYCSNCGSYLPQNLDGTRTHTCRNCGWSGETLKAKWQAFLKGVEKEKAWK